MGEDKGLLICSKFSPWSMPIQFSFASASPSCDFFLPSICLTISMPFSARASLASFLDPHGLSNATVASPICSTPLKVATSASPSISNTGVSPLAWQSMYKAETWWLVLLPTCMGSTVVGFRLSCFFWALDRDILELETGSESRAAFLGSVR